MEVRAAGVLELGSGDLFQVRVGTAKRFRELHAAMQHAVIWESERAVPQVAVVAPPTTNGQFPGVESLSQELEHLASLLERGLLTAEEFAAAKARLLA